MKSYIICLFLFFLFIIPAAGQGTINNRPGEMNNKTPGETAPVTSLPSEQASESMKSTPPSTVFYGQNLSMGGTGSTPPDGGSIGSVPIGNIPLISLLLISLVYASFRGSRCRNAIKNK